MSGLGTAQYPWQLVTSDGIDYVSYLDQAAQPPVLVCQAGLVSYRYRMEAISDLAAMLAASGEWHDLGGVEEDQTPAAGSIEAWGRSPDNPVGGWYGLVPGLRGQFATFLAPLLQELGLADLLDGRVRAR